MCHPVSKEGGGFCFVLLETEVCLVEIELPEGLKAELTGLQKAIE